MKVCDKTIKTKKSMAKRFKCLRLCCDSSLFHIFIAILIVPMAVLSAVFASESYGLYIIVPSAVCAFLYILVILISLCDNRSCIRGCVNSKRVDVYNRPNICSAIFLRNSKFVRFYKNKDIVHKDSIIEMARSVLSQLESARKTQLSEKVFIIAKKDLRCIKDIFKDGGDMLQCSTYYHCEMPEDIETHISTIVDETPDNFSNLWGKCKGDMTVDKVIRKASEISRDKDRKKQEDKPNATKEKVTK